MRNRAKCKKCNELLESFHLHDEVECKCGEVRISGGSQKYLCFAKNWDNFLRIDDEGKEVGVQVVEKGEEDVYQKIEEKEEVPVVIQELKHVIDYLEGLDPKQLD